MSRHIKSWRIKEAEELYRLFPNYKVIAIGSLEGFPTSLLQKLKKNLDDVIFRVTTKSILKRVLEKLNHKDLIKTLPNQAIIILTNKNVFEFYQDIKKNKAKSKAKVNMISPIDIFVLKGDTGLPPGPALSDLKKVGIKAQVRGATIFVPKDTLITKKGEIIDIDTVSILSKLGIKPIELILDIVSAKENNLIYSKDALDVDRDQIFSKFMNAVRCSINLAVEVSYFTKLSIDPMIKKAYLEAKVLDALVNKK